MLFLIMLANAVDMSNPVLNFNSYSYETALEKAENDNMLVFVNFNSVNDESCLVMSETTFKDYDVIEFMESYFISVDANLEKKIGQKWVNKFKVNCLPTYMVLDHEGCLLALNQGELSSFDFLDWIKQIDKVNQMIFGTLDFGSVMTDESNKIVKPVLEEEEEEEEEEEKEEEAKFEQKKEIEILENSTTLSSTELNNYLEAQVVNNTSFGPGEDDQAPIERVRLPREYILINYQDNPTMKYSIQIGAFNNYANARQRIEQLKENINERLYIIEEKQSAKVFKVIVGTFAAEAKAKDTLNYLKEMGFEGFVRRI